MSSAARPVAQASFARRFARVSLLVGAALVLCAGSLYAWWALALDHFVTIRPGEIYRSGAMAPEALLATVRDYGIRSVVDLRRDVDAARAERTLLERVGVRHFHIPSRQVPERRTIEAFLEVVSRPENRPLLIHCTHGVGRAPLYEALYRIEFEGWSNESARRSVYWRSGLGRFTLDDKKGRFLERYQPMRRIGSGA